MSENILGNTEDPLVKWIREHPSTGLGTIQSNTTTDVSGLGNLNPAVTSTSLTDDYFKMQMLKPGETENKDMFMGMSPTEWSSAMKAGQLGLGAANLGLGALSYFQNKGLADKQKEVLGQQIESNRAEIAARKNYRSALEKF